MTETNVMASEAIPTPPPATQATTANEAPISPMLKRWVDFIELIESEICPVPQDNEVAPYIKEAEERRNAKAEKRVYAKLRKQEIEQKAILLAEAKESMEEARRKFESEPQVPYDYPPRPPTSINDIFRGEKAKDELKALEREQKDELLRQIMEKRAQECGEQWTPAEESPDKPRSDHIPKYWPGEKEIIAKAFQWVSPIKSQESNE